MRFLVMTSNVKPRELGLWNEAKVTMGSVRCPIHDGHDRGGARSKQLHADFKIVPKTDVLWTWHNEPIANAKVKAVVDGYGLTGIRFQEAVVRFKKGSEWSLAADWVEMVCVGSGGPAAAKSGRRIRSTCPGCGWPDYSDILEASALVDERAWDGSDVFRVKDFGWLFVTERVQSVFEKEGVTGSRFVVPDNRRLE